ncbi:MAG: helix-turn-helix transcriptional regulator [Proteobacteria bacterium]|nr:helix-turn-helix transcriptional regulator [Pseudomonadota bacterium]
MDIRRRFGTNLRRCRLAAGLSQEEVAERMGVDRAHVSSMERGQQNVTLSTLGFVAQALKIDPAALLAPTSETAAEPNAARKVAPRRRLS